MSIELPTLSDAEDVEGRRVLVRAGLNVPIQDGVVANDFRIKKALETIDNLRGRGAKVLIVSHLGRDPKETLMPVYERIKRDVPDMQFARNFSSDETDALLAGMNDGDVVMFENVRATSDEKENDPDFAKQLAGLADIYVNDAFAASHRAHASIVGIPEHIPGFAGKQLEREITELGEALTPESPSLFIVGGAKFETKAPILRMALETYDTCFVGGALANDFLKAKGYNVGASLVSDDAAGITDILEHERLMLPTDVIAVNGADVARTCAVDDVHDDEKILDIGPESVAALMIKVREAKSILWNGPMGFYEGGYNESTESIAEAVAQGDNQSIVGGGDTVAAIEKLGLAHQFTFLSTGGGAMLDFLADAKLPGVEALQNSQR